MPGLVRRALAVAVAGALLTADAHAKDPKPKAGPILPAPVASQIVVRRQTDLGDAMRLALSRVGGLSPASSVAVVVDPTAAVVQAKEAIADALASLSSLEKRPTTWQVGMLGSPLLPPVPDPAALRAPLETLLARRAKPGVDTFAMLRKSLSNVAGKAGGAILYLAHAHFEEDLGVEEFVSAQRAAHRSLCVIGPEAAFERGWAGTLADVDGWREVKGELVTSPPGVGTNPFGPPDPTAPWHGGDTANPHVPYDFGASWTTVFRPRSAWKQHIKEFHKGVEDELGKAKAMTDPPPDPASDPAAFAAWARHWVTPPDRETKPDEFRAWIEKVGRPPNRETDREAYDAWFDDLLLSAPAASSKPAPSLPRLPVPDAGSVADSWRTQVPVPSGFGAYGLMRAAGLTGGCYVLWGWTKGDTAPVKYDYGKCDLLGPDLRSRAEIFADLVHRPLGFALLQAWAALADSTPGIASVAPPVKAGVPQRLEFNSSLVLLGIFEKPAERDERVAEAKAALPTLDRVRATLEGAIRDAGDPKDDVDRRYRADAHLLVHALQTIRFEAAEFVKGCEAIPKEAWKAGPKKTPDLQNEQFVVDAEDDEPVKRRTEAHPYDADAADAIVKARTEFLERYRGTPFGAIVAKNSVWTYHLDTIDLTGTAYVDVPRSGKGSSTGGGPKTPPPPPSGGSAGGGGPTTGK
jgi:hypothetical protein